MTAQVDGLDIVIGNAALLDEMGVAHAPLADEASRLAEQGKTPVYAAIDGRPVAIVRHCRPAEAPVLPRPSPCSIAWA